MPISKRPTAEAVFLSPRETAACLGVTRQTVHALVHQKAIPSVLLGHNRLIPRSFIDDLQAKAMAEFESAA